MAEHSLAICFPVWNRADLFEASYSSLVRQLDTIDASIWIVDNGSDAPTKLAIAKADSERHGIFKITLPANMGIPYAVNVFSGMAGLSCAFANHRPADFVMIADADCYFKRPLRELIEILEGSPNAGAIAGHDSIEHEARRSFVFATGGGERVVKEKAVERGLCLLMRREILAGCVPFPTDTPLDFDWQLGQLHANSIEALGLKMLAADYVVHLGLYDSTWHPIGVPADAGQLQEIDSLLTALDLMSAARRRRMEHYRSHYGLPQPNAPSLA
jgi:glycosyltransferase involved in cell wall biosynthesis